MKITICGSAAFHDKMIEVQTQLEAFGHEARIPEAKFTDGRGNNITIKNAYLNRQNATPTDTWVWDEKRAAIFGHFEKVVWADVILVLNYDKNDIPGYIGANTLIEMSLALYFHKPIFLFNEVPRMSYSEEILAMKATILHGDIKKL